MIDSKKGAVIPARSKSPGLARNVEPPSKSGHLKRIRINGSQLAGKDNRVKGHSDFETGANRS